MLYLKADHPFVEGKYLDTLGHLGLSHMHLEATISWYETTFGSCSLIASADVLVMFKPMLPVTAAVLYASDSKCAVCGDAPGLSGYF